MNISKIQNNLVLKICGIIMICLSIVLALWFLLRGQINVTGKYPDDITEQSVVCEIKNQDYYLYGKTNALNSITNIVSVFSQEKIKSVSLSYSATFSDQRAAEDFEAIMIFGLNSHIEKEYGFNGLGANFTTKGTTARFSITANSSELNDASKNYFLMDNIANNPDAFLASFEEKGFSCKKIN